MSLLTGQQSSGAVGPTMGAAVPSQGVITAEARVPGVKVKLTKEEKRAKAKAKRQQKVDAALLLKKALEDAHVNLTVDQKAALELLTKAPRSGGGGFGESTFNKIFGAEPKVDDSVTIEQILEKTGCRVGIQQMNTLVKKWAAKGTAQVAYIHNPTSPFKSQYSIKSLGGK